MRATLGVMALLVLAGCTERDPTYCDESIPCEGPGLICDLEKKECVPAPDATSDLSLISDTTNDLPGGHDIAADLPQFDSAGDIAPVDLTPREGCVNTCPKTGARQCVGNGFQLCGNHNADPCLEWGPTTACTANQFCLEGTCLSWKTVSSGITTELRDVWGAAANDIWAVGTCSGILRYNGQKWAPDTRYDPTCGRLSQTFTSIWGSSFKDVWLTYESGALLQPILQKSYPGTTLDLFAIWGSATTNAWAAGKTFLFWSGASWTEFKPAGLTHPIRGIWVASPNTAWAVGDYGTMWKLAAATTWQPQTVSTTEHLGDIHGTTASNIWAVGGFGTTLRYNGTKWSDVLTPTTKGLNGVWTASTTTAWAVGDSGTIVRYDGAKWVAVMSPTQKKLNAVWGSSPTDVWAVGEAGTILHTEP
jgi:hypothetical protein